MGAAAMGAALLRGGALPPAAFETALCAAAGWPLPMVRFALAFALAVPVNVVFRRVPTPTGAQLHCRRCGAAAAAAAAV